MNTPLATDLNTLVFALGSVAGNVSEEIWINIRGIRDNLQALAEQVRALEQSACIDSPAAEVPHAC